jgi:hypothetical protein
MRALLLVAFMFCLPSGYAQELRLKPVVQEKADTQNADSNATKVKLAEPSTSTVLLGDQSTCKDAEKDNEEPSLKKARTEAEFSSFKATYFNAWIAFGVMVIAAFQAWFFWIQLSRMKESNETASKAAQAALNQSERSMATERAYVRINYKGIGIKHDPKDNFFTVDFEIKNWGRSPANMTDARFRASEIECGAALPFEFPDEERESFPNAFLAPGGSAHEISKTFPVGNKADNLIQNDKQVWVFGYVDYIDSFEKRWRSRFVRKYVHRTGENLTYNREAHDEFEHERAPGVGIDWTPDAIEKYNAICSAPLKRWLWQWPYVYK